MSSLPCAGVTAPRRRLAAVVAAAALLAGCGGGSDKPSTVPAHAKRGGTLHVLSQSDVDSIDPGITYYTGGYLVSNSTQRPLVNYRPDAPERPVPDLAETLPQVSADGRTVTVKIRSGVRFSPPVDREVTSKDVRYAIERGFFNTVNNAYVGTYFGDVVGARAGAKPGKKIRGIETPDDRTIVFHLRRATGGALAGALSLPISAPVPAGYAARFDRRNPSTYGKNQVATGPYMLAGYKAGRSIKLVRNPSWDARTDYKPAYLDAIEIAEGNDDTTVAARRILAGSHMVSGDFPAPPPVIAQAVKRQRDQLALVPSGQLDYTPLNTAIPPFDDVNVRRAVVAGIDREAIRLAAGGKIRGDLSTHFLPPSIPGFDQAGGVKGPSLDFLAHPKGNRELAADYFRKAGYASGRYEGQDEVFVVGINDPRSQRASEIIQRALTDMGFKVRLKMVAADAFFTKYCTVPKAEVNMCTGWGWVRDFPDGQTILDPTFNGEQIKPQGNSNVSQLNVPAINRAMAHAESLSDPAERARAWGEIDRQVTAQAPAIPGIWSNQPVVRSKDVAAVANPNLAGWDFTFTSLR